MEQQTNSQRIEEANPGLKKGRVTPFRRQEDELHAAVKARYALYWEILSSYEASDTMATMIAPPHEPPESMSTETATPNSRARIQLDYLPAEILIEIASYLPHYELNSLIKSTRTLYTRLNPVLYSTFPINTFFNSKWPVGSAISALPSYVSRFNLVTTQRIETAFNAFPHLIEVRIDDFSGQWGFRPKKGAPPEINQAFDTQPAEDDASLSSSLYSYLYTSPPNWKEIVAHAEARAVEISMRFSDNLSHLQALTVTILSTAAFETLLGKCSNLRYIEICTSNTGVSPYLDNVMQVMGRTVGKTLRTLYIHDPPPYTRQPDVGVFFRSLGQPDLFPVFENIRFRQLDKTLYRNEGIARYHLLMDLYKAQVAAAAGGVRWTFNQEYGTSVPFAFSMIEASCFRRCFDKLPRLLDWLAEQCPVWGVDKYPLGVIALLGEEFPVRISYNSSSPPKHYDTRWIAKRLPRYAGNSGWMDSGTNFGDADDADDDEFDDGDDNYDDREWPELMKATAAGRLHTLNLAIAGLDIYAIEKCIENINRDRYPHPTRYDQLCILNHDQTDIWSRFLVYFLPRLINLTKLILGPRDLTSPFGGFFCPDTLRSTVSTLVHEFHLVNLEVDMSSIWQCDVPGSRVCQRPPGIGYSDLIYRMHWLADERLMVNLTHLTLRKLFITKWGDREWFYHLPGRLANLKKFTVIGLVWDVGQAETEESRLREETERTRRKTFAINRRYESLVRMLCPENEIITTLNLEPELDTTIDPSLSEMVNHGLRKIRVAERIARNINKAARTNDPQREFSFHIEDLRLFTGRGFGTGPSSIMSPNGEGLSGDGGGGGGGGGGGFGDVGEDGRAEVYFADWLWAREELGYFDLNKFEDAPFDGSPEEMESRVRV